MESNDQDKVNAAVQQKGPALAVPVGFIIHLDNIRLHAYLKTQQKFLGLGREVLLHPFTQPYVYRFPCFGFFEMHQIISKGDIKIHLEPRPRIEGH